MARSHQVIKAICSGVPPFGQFWQLSFGASLLAHYSSMVWEGPWSQFWHHVWGDPLVAHFNNLFQKCPLLVNFDNLNTILGNSGLTFSNKSHL